MIKTVLLFAAGYGKRMKHLTESNPKSLISILGKPILHYSLELCTQLGPEKIVINTHYMSHRIEESLREFRLANPDFPPILTIHEDELLETGGAIRNAIGLIGHEPIFTLNTDVIIQPRDNPFAEMQKKWDPEKMDFLLLLQPFEQATGYRGSGDFEMMEDGRLIRPDVPGNYSFMYTGLQILKPEKIIQNPQKIFSLREYYLNNDRAYGMMLKNARWYHATRPEDITGIESMLLAHLPD